MALVCFEKIAKIMASQASPMYPGAVAVDATTEPTRPHLFDPLWGYFAFGQSLRIEYTEAQAYQDVGVFTISGVFTPDAVGVHETDSDESAFSLMVAKYTALEQKLKDAAEADVPTSYDQWGTTNDPRCIPLPTPLVDADGHPICAFPVSLRIDKTTFPTEIRYIATLQEAKLSLAKGVVNDFPVDNCVVAITLPQPQFAQHQIVGASGEVLQLKHYKTMEVDISGTMPLKQDGVAISAVMKALADSLTQGWLKLDVAVRSSTGVSTETVWDKLDITDEPAVECDYQNQVSSVNVRSRE